LRPAVSIVLPVHNGMPYIGECVRSLLAQTLTDFELVIGDDGSSDGTSEVVAALAKADSRIRPLRRERASGLASSANWVVANSVAPLVAVAHADDLSAPTRLEREAALLAAAPEVDLVGSLWNGIDEEGRQVRPGDWWRLRRLSRFAPFSHSSIMFRRAAFDRVGGYRARAEYWEDLDLYYRIARHGRVVVIPEILSTVRHARISTRLRDDQDRVERAVDLMYRTSRAYGRRASREAGAAAGGGTRLHPLTFVSCGSTNLWGGRSPAMWKRLWRRGRLGVDAVSLHALAWVGWGTVSPRSLRAFLRLLMGLRNRIARPRFRRLGYVDWTPRGRDFHAFNPDPARLPELTMDPSIPRA
jgi:glycosyltransferase involved in cell wall biosynthesis